MSKSPLLINIGGSKGWKKFAPKITETWTCMDVTKCDDPDKIHYDLNSGTLFPMADSAVVAYYTSHTLEHVHISRLSFVFAEMFRTLRPGGTIRIVLPDMEKGICAYSKQSLGSIRGGPSVPADYPLTELGKLMAWWATPDRETGASGHHSAFDWETLSWYLRTAGFKNIVKKAYNDMNPIFTGLDFPRYAEFSLYVEAIK